MIHLTCVVFLPIDKISMVPIPSWIAVGKQEGLRITVPHIVKVRCVPYNLNMKSLESVMLKKVASKIL